MHLTKPLRLIPIHRMLGGSAVLAIGLLLGCTDGGEDEDPPPSFAAQEIRVLSKNAAEGDWKTSYFPGLVLVADVDPWSDRGRKAVVDDAGNEFWLPIVDGGFLFSRVRGAGGAVELVGAAPSGAISSALDLDGDGSVDLFDALGPDGSRHTLFNELGREYLDRWLDGVDPRCQEYRFLAGASPFGCDDEEGERGGGGSVGMGAGSIGDPFASICSTYRSQPERPQPPVHSHGGHGYGSVLRVTGFFGWTRDDEGNYGRAFMVGIQYRFDEAGHHVSTTRETRYYDEHGSLVRTIHERVDHEGNGTRTVTEHRGDGTTSTRSRDFRTRVEPNGKYETSSPWNDEDAPERIREERENRPAEDEETIDRVWPESATTPGQRDPGSNEPAFDPSGDWEAWCKATEKGRNPSGVERLVDVDHGLFDDEICVSPESDGGSRGNCIDLSATRRMDLEAVLEPPAGGNDCGPFEQPGEDGSCGPASGVQFLLGLTARLAAARLEDIEICDPAVCQPGFFRAR